MNNIFKLDEEKLDQLLEECVNKEQKFRKSCKPKKSNRKLFEQLMEDDLKKKGYIK